MRLDQITPHEMSAVDKYVAFLKKELLKDYRNDPIIFYKIKKATERFENERVVEREESEV